jgi:hypothetical protein
MFTESCYIRKNTSELRDRLKKLGKEVCVCCTFADNIWLCSDSKYVHGIGGFDDVEPYTQEGALKRFVEENPKDIDCGENEELFLAIALMQDDVDKNQWFKTNNGVEIDTYTSPSYKEWYLFTGKEVNFPFDKYHKATVNELIKLGIGLI